MCRIAHCSVKGNMSVFEIVNSEHLHPLKQSNTQTKLLITGYDFLLCGSTNYSSWMGDMHFIHAHYLPVRRRHWLTVLASDSGDKWLSHCWLRSAVIHVNARPVLLTLTAQRKNCAKAAATLAPLAGSTAIGKDVSFMISDLNFHHWRLSDWKIRMTCCLHLDTRINPSLFVTGSLPGSQLQGMLPRLSCCHLH